LHHFHSRGRAALISCALLALPTGALAQGPASFGVGVTGGTLGIGPEVSVGISENFGVRGSATFLNFSADYSTADLDYDGRLKLNNWGAMIDLFPTGGGFHVSGGLRVNHNRADLTATPTNSVTFGTTTYTPAQIGTISGSADLPETSPAVTIGYRKRSKGFSLGVEAGALFQGSVRINQFKSSTGLIAQADLDAERDSLQDDVNKYKVYPILQFVLGLRF
jgi:hypothetical protein